MRLVVGVGGVQDSLDGAVVDIDGSGDPVQRVAVLTGHQDRLDGLDGLAGCLGGNQLGGELSGRGAPRGRARLKPR